MKNKNNRKDESKETTDGLFIGCLAFGGCIFGGFVAMTFSGSYELGIVVAAILFGLFIWKAEKL